MQKIMPILKLFSKILGTDEVDWMKFDKTTKTKKNEEEGTAQYKFLYRTVKKKYI